MARSLRPLVRGGGYYPSNRLTPLVYPGGYTTANGGGEPEPPPIEKTIIGNPIHILDALAKPVQALSIALEPIQDLHGYDNPWPAGGGKNLLTALPSPGITVWFCEPNGFTFKANQTYCFSIGNGITVGSYAIYAADKTTQLAYANSNRKVTYTPTVDTVGYPRLYAGEGVSQEAINSAQLELGNSRTTYAPYSNICPISGHTDADVIVSSTLNPLEGTTYPIPLGQTVYGGTLDVVTGVLTVDRALWTASAGNLARSGDNAFYSTAILNIKYSQTKNTTDVISNKFKAGVENNQDTCFINTNGRIRLNTSTSYSTVANMLADIGEITVVYPLATPQTIQLTPTQIELLQGENNIWSDGEMTLVYLADGNASDVEALNILLGGRYVNNHGEDEPTDREALDILLGRTR